MSAAAWPWTRVPPRETTHRQEGDGTGYRYAPPSSGGAPAIAARSRSAEAARLVSGVDDQQRETPEPVAIDRQRRAGDPAVVLAHPRPAGVAPQQLLVAHQLL